VSEAAGTPLPLLIVLSGPSGVGKDAVLAELRETHPEIFFAVTATTRPKRPGEIEGQDYLFLTPGRFEQLLERGEFLEHAEVYGRHYGVPKGPLREALARGEDVVVKVDVQGAATIRKLAPDAFLIFLAAPTEEELERRLTTRKTESPEQVALRIQTAKREMQAASWFDRVIVNETDSLHQTVVRIVDVARERRADANRRPVAL
jgi:guanylate kinase